MHLHIIILAKLIKNMSIHNNRGLGKLKVIVIIKTTK